MGPGLIDLSIGPISMGPGLIDRTFQLNLAPLKSGGDISIEPGTIESRRMGS
jgi:hypothetical protein